MPWFHFTTTNGHVLIVKERKNYDICFFFTKFASFLVDWDCIRVPYSSYTYKIYIKKRRISEFIVYKTNTTKHIVSCDNNRFILFEVLKYKRNRCFKERKKSSI